jgi:hypothetical protein
MRGKTSVAQDVEGHWLLSVCPEMVEGFTWQEPGLRILRRKGAGIPIPSVRLTMQPMS